MKPYYEHGGITIWHGDCRDILPTLKPCSVVTDPPYGIAYQSNSRGAPSSTRTAGGEYGKEWGAIAGDAGRFDPAHIVGLPCPVVIWGANNFNQSIPESGRWLVWDKKRGGTAAAGFHAAHVELAWCSVGRKLEIFPYFWDGFRRQGEIHEHYHPTQKPKALMRWCIEHVGADGVTDPYMGSGTTLVAAKEMGCRAIGIEIEERYCEIAAKRLAQEVLDFEATP